MLVLVADSHLVYLIFYMSTKTFNTRTEKQQEHSYYSSAHAGQNPDMSLLWLFNAINRDLVET